MAKQNKAQQSKRVKEKMNTQQNRTEHRIAVKNRTQHPTEQNRIKQHKM